MKVVVKFLKSDKILLSKDVDAAKFTYGNLLNDVSAKLCLSISRIGLRQTKRGKSLKLSEKSLLKDIPCDEPDGITLYFVDFGPQIGYRTVYILEYLCALIPYVLLYLRLEKQSPLNDYKIGCKTRLAAICWASHFIKRILESIYLHKFSRASMPFSFAIRNMLYYGGFSLLVGYFVNQYQNITPPGDFSHLIVCFVGFFICVYCNWRCHIVLSKLRNGDSDTSRVAPRPDGLSPTLLYNWVSFPNYFYEILTWVFFTALTRSYASASFTLVGMITMTTWALEKHAQYKKDPQYPKKRKAIFPMIL